MQDNVVAQFRGQRYQLDIEADISFSGTTSPARPLVPQGCFIKGETVLLSQLIESINYLLSGCGSINREKNIVKSFLLFFIYFNFYQVFLNPRFFRADEFNSGFHRGAPWHGYPDALMRSDGDEDTPGAGASVYKYRAEHSALTRMG